MSSVDPAAVKTIREMHDNQEKDGIQVFYAGCPTNVREVMTQCKLFKDKPFQYFYPSVEHAILHLEYLSKTAKSDSEDVDDERQLVVTPNGNHLYTVYDNKNN